MCANFQAKRTILIFLVQISPKTNFGLGFQKSKSVFGISTSKIPCVATFSQNGQICVFGLNLDQLPNYVQNFGSCKVEESKKEAGMSWMEVGGGGWRWVQVGGGGCTFSNTHTDN